jgi:hypothetical protein
MSGCGCDSVCNVAPPDPRYRRALWIALVLNALMFFVEMFASFAAQSVSLLADAVDFLGDAVNYGVALFVLGLAPVWRSRTALWKGWLMVGFGVFVLGKSAWQWSAGVVPAPNPEVERLAQRYPAPEQPGFFSQLAKSFGVGVDQGAAALDTIGAVGQDAAPRVENHHLLRAGFDLRVQIVDHCAGGHFQDVMHQVGTAVDHLLDLGVAVAALAFDHVAGQRERAAGEADQWY